MPASKAQQATTAKRRAQATALKLAGMDWQTIADRLDYSDRGAACKDVSRALEASLADQRASGEALREIELLRLDRLQAAAWSNAIKGDLKAIETCLKILDRRAKYLGLDSAIRLEVLTIDALDQQIAALNEQIAAADREAGEVAAAEESAD